jgi:predicted RNA-binding protein with PUA-like domain
MKAEGDMAHWLIKSEPSAYSWEQLVKDKKTSWTGVRNAQASSNLKAMKVGDRCFFYHSNEGKEIVGIAEVVKGAYPDPTDKEGKSVTVDVKAVDPVKQHVTLAAIKAEPKLKDFGLVRQSRLSVVPVSDEQWKLIMKMSTGLKKSDNT